MIEEYDVAIQYKEVIYRCDKCDSGRMEVYGDFVYTTSPPMYPHKCTYCNYTQNFVGVTYPHLIKRVYQTNGWGEDEWTRV